MTLQDLVVDSAGKLKEVPVGCCVIGYDEPPRLTEAYHFHHDHSSPTQYNAGHVHKTNAGQDAATNHKHGKYGYHSHDHAHTPA